MNPPVRRNAARALRSGAALTALLLATFGEAAAPTKLETVVVSASRTPQAQQDVSASIAVISGEELDRISAVHISEALNRLPGTWISRGNGQEHLTAIRSPVFTGPGSCGAFYFAEDGIPIRPTGVCNVNELSEINSEQASRIEVLRGPGTAIHGSNAQHGVINVISRQPPEQRETNLALELGPSRYARFLASHGDSRPGNAYRISVNAAHDGGYKDHSGFKQQKLSYRHDLEWSAVSVQSLLSINNLDQQTASFVIGKNAYARSERKKENPNREAFRENRSARWYGRFDLQAANGDELTITPFVRYQDMKFLQHFLVGQPLEENGFYGAGWQSTWAHEFSPRVTLRTGIDGEWSKSSLEETQQQVVRTSSVLPLGKHYDFRVEAFGAAIFAQLEWETSERTRLDAGLRAERQRYEYDNRMLDGATRDNGSRCGSALAPLPCRYSRPADRNDVFNDASFHLGYSHALSETQTLILNIAHGFRPPQTAELYRLQAGQVVTDIDSERLDSIELGWRGSIGTIDYQLVAFHMEKQDVIFQDAQRRNVGNAETEHAGMEYSVSWKLAEHWALSSDGTWARHRYTSADALQGLPAGQSIKGNDIDTAPRVIASTRLLWQATPRTVAELEWQHMGRHYLEPTETFDYPGHDLLNLRVTHEFSDRLHGAIRFTNLSDEDYAERADFAFGDYRYFVGEPRSVYIEGGWTF
jgi:iron complex outermembrane recepter protein